MYPQTARYYRAILFGDPEAQEPIPPGLVTMNSWTEKAHLNMGLGSQITKYLALNVVLSWLHTNEGREFAAETPLAVLFSGKVRSPKAPPIVPAGT